MFVAGYGHFLRTAASLQWDEAAVDLSADARAWPALEPALRERLLRLVAGFCVGEAAVAEELSPFALAAPDADAAACFEVQAIDEARHAHFFDRVAVEVAGVAGEGAAERRRALAAVLDERFLALFERRLPAVARALAGGASTQGLASAVSLYHLLLEGIVFTAGQLALVRLLDRADPPLPGLRRGLELVLADERWHIGFGARLLAEIGAAPELADRLLSEGRSALSAWEEALDEDLAARVLALHARRLRAARLVAGPAAA